MAINRMLYVQYRIVSMTVFESYFVCNTECVFFSLFCLLYSYLPNVFQKFMFRLPGAKPRTRKCVRVGYNKIHLKKIR